MTEPKKSFLETQFDKNYEAATINDDLNCRQVALLKRIADLLVINSHENTVMEKQLDVIIERLGGAALS